MKQHLLLALFNLALVISTSAQSNSSDIQTYLNNTAKNYNLETEDLQNWVITNKYVSQKSGITHIYLRQTYGDIEVRTANAAIHVTRSGEILTMSNRFVKDLDQKIANSSSPLDAPAALIEMAQQMDYHQTAAVTVLEPAIGPQKEGLLKADNISIRDIKTKLMYEPLENGTFTIAWNMPIYELDQSDWWDMRIDAATGLILSKDNWITSCNFDDPNHTHDHGTHAHGAEHPSPLLPHATEEQSWMSNLMVGSYNVFAMPIESPNFGDRSIVTDPEDLVASPFGWHDTDGAAGAEFTITRGNNCHAYEDGDNDGFSPDGNAALNFDFPFNPVYSNDDQSEAAVITNLFYWTNLCHDVWYQYGFDEASGNFQENNYGNGGAGSDYVNAEAQDGSGTCNANFGTPTDGSNPTMQMYTCNSRDGDVDNAVIVHEYGHGISIRLTGGPGNSSCLNNSEQMGEGWSDWFSLMMTLEEGDAGDDPRGMGTWLLGQGPDGNGIRPHRYSTDMTENPHTYGSIGSEAIPHGVGSVWCMMLWEMAWALIDEHGFDPDFYNGTGGNNMAMELVIEGLKLQPCNPGFVDGRDAILAADQALNGGANVCLIWEAFAKRGLGFSAQQGSSGSTTDGTEAFDIAPSCNLGLVKTVDKTEVELGQTLTYTLVSTNATANLLTNVVITDDVPVHTTYSEGSASDGGSEAGGTVTFPGVDLAPGASITRTFSVTVNADAPVSGAPLFEDDMENGTTEWVEVTTGASNWVQNGTNPNSGSTAWFAADIASTALQYLTLVNPVIPTSSSTLDFYHDYNTEANWDGGYVEISTDNGGSWTDLGPFMTQNGYTGRINNNANTPAFSGDSQGYILTSVDLSSFAGQSIIFRFVMSTDNIVGDEGWYIDDVIVGNVVKIPNIANVSAAEGLSSEVALATPTCIIGDVVPFINFQTTSYTASEDATVRLDNLVGNCRTFTDYTLDVTITADPSVPAEVQVTIPNTIATNIEDFELMTNTLTIPSTGIYPITLRVYDDASIETSETITLSLAITNPDVTDAVIGTQSSATFTVNDNDLPPTGGLMMTAPVDADVEADDGGLTSTNSGGDDWVSGTEGDATSGNWDVPNNGSTRLFYVNDDACNCDMSDVKLLLPSLDLSTPVSAALSLDIFFEGRTYNNITETAQLEVSLDGGTTFNSIATIDGQLDNWRNEVFDLAAYLGNNDVRLAIRYNDGGDWLYGMAVDNVQVNVEDNIVIPIANEISDTDEQYVGTFSDVYFYDNNGDIMARIQSYGHNFGCVELTVDRAGTGAIDFQDNVTANRLAEKTFTFTPEFNSPSGEYDVTLYYKQDEVEGWQTATGHTWADAKVIKNPSAISNITPDTPEPDGAGTVIVKDVLAAGHPDFSTPNYYIQANFTTGFSGIGVGNPEFVLPIELLNFTGEHVATKGNAIQWTTLLETQNEFFLLERSFDGQHFDKIATIEANNLGNQQNHYEFLDTKYQKGDNYYRLIQQDVNGQQTMTEAIIIQVKGTQPTVHIFPNPTQGVVYVQFDEVLETNLEMELIDALGRVVQRQVIDVNTAQHFNFNTQRLSNGVYYLSLKYNGSVVQEKIVKTN